MRLPKVRPAWGVLGVNSRRRSQEQPQLTKEPPCASFIRVNLREGLGVIAGTATHWCVDHASGLCDRTFGHEAEVAVYVERVLA